MATAAKTPPAPLADAPPAPVAQGAEAIASPPPPPIRPLAPSKMKLSEHAAHSFEVTLDPGVTLETALKPEFWSLQPGGEYGLRPGDRIHCHAADRSFVAVLYVWDFSTSRPVAGVKGGAEVSVLNYLERGAREMKPRQPTHEVRWGGPTIGHTIVRIRDNHTVVQNLGSEEDAQRHLAGMIRTGQA